MLLDALPQLPAIEDTMAVKTIRWFPSSQHTSFWYKQYGTVRLEDHGAAGHRRIHPPVPGVDAATGTDAAARRWEKNSQVAF